MGRITKLRLQEFGQDVKALGVDFVEIGYPTCCGSCASAAIDADHPDIETSFWVEQRSDGGALDVRLDDGDSIYFNHTGLDRKLYGDIREAAIARGFQTEWTGSDMRCVEVRR